jgi:hypothetical protein
MGYPDPIMPDVDQLISDLTLLLHGSLEHELRHMSDAIRRLAERSAELRKRDRANALTELLLKRLDDAAESGASKVEISVAELADVRVGRKL